MARQKQITHKPKQDKYIKEAVVHKIRSFVLWLDFLLFTLHILLQPSKKRHQKPENPNQLAKYEVRLVIQLKNKTMPNKIIR